MYLGLWLLMAGVVVCWATGAYRRLMRLRTGVVESWTPLAETAQRLVSVMQATLQWSAPARTPPTSGPPRSLECGAAAQPAPERAENAEGAECAVTAVQDVAVASALVPMQGSAADATEPLLRGALLQFVAAVAAAQSRPWAEETADAYATAQELLWQIWQLRQQHMHELAGPTADAAASSLAAEAPVHGELDVSYALLLSQGRQAESQYRLMAEKFNLAASAYNLAVSQFPALLMARCMGFQPVRQLQVPNWTSPTQMTS